MLLLNLFLFRSSKRLEEAEATKSQVIELTHT